MPTGRPSRLTPAMQKAICKSVEAGNYLQVVAEMVGVSRSTIFRCLSEADGGDNKYVAFRDAVKKAQAEADTGA